MKNKWVRFLTKLGFMGVFAAMTLYFIGENSILLATLSGWSGGIITLAVIQESTEW